MEQEEFAVGNELPMEIIVHIMEAVDFKIARKKT